MKTTKLALITLVAVRASILAADTSGNIGPIETKVVDAASAKNHFVLTVPVELHSKDKIDPKDVMVKVNFYDRVSGKLVNTTASINYRWQQHPTNWLNGGKEILEVEYNPVPDAAADRQFFGYIVSVYYLDKLRATHAEPESLATEFPVSKSIQ